MKIINNLYGDNTEYHYCSLSLLVGSHRRLWDSLVMLVELIFLSYFGTEKILGFTLQHLRVVPLSSLIEHNRLGSWGWQKHPTHGTGWPLVPEHWGKILPSYVEKFMFENFMSSLQIRFVNIFKFRLNKLILPESK